MFDPDESCVDPKDAHQRGRRHYDVIEGDAIILWREQADPDSPDGHDDIHVVASGVFESITLKTAKKMARKAGIL